MKPVRQTNGVRPIAAITLALIIPIGAAQADTPCPPGQPSILSIDDGDNVINTVQRCVGSTRSLRFNPWFFGTFTFGMMGWESDSVGGEVQGDVEIVDRLARINENDAELVTLYQAFLLPVGADELSFRVDVESGFDGEDPASPDAFEVHLFDEQYQSVVESWHASATSFFNMQETGEVNMSSAAAWDGTTVTLQLPPLEADTRLILCVDLIGGDTDANTKLDVDDFRFRGGGITNRMSTSTKGSVAVFPNVEVRFDGPDPSTAEILHDTFITVTNDIDRPVDVHMLFVHEDCEHLDTTLYMTSDHTCYWSCATGQPGTFNRGPLTPFWHRGLREDPARPGTWISRGYIVAIAVNGVGSQIRHNYLSGEAMMVDYEAGTVWEYNAYTFRVLNPVPDGAIAGVPGIIEMDGTTYESGSNTLVLTFNATGGTAYARPGQGDVVHDTELTLMMLEADTRIAPGQPGQPWPYHTLVLFDRIWNENESPVSGTHYCIRKWDRRRLGDVSAVFGPLLHTNRGYARIDTTAHRGCEVWEVVHQTNTVELTEASIETPLLGTAAQILTMSTPQGLVTAKAGRALRGAGWQSATFYYDLPSEGESAPVLPDTTGVEATEGNIHGQHLKR